MSSEKSGGNEDFAASHCSNSEPKDSGHVMLTIPSSARPYVCTVLRCVGDLVSQQYGVNCISQWRMHENEPNEVTPEDKVIEFWVRDRSVVQSAI